MSIGTILTKYGGKAGGLTLAVGMVISFVESRDAKQQQRAEAQAREKASIELHERIARLESAVTFYRGQKWVEESKPAEKLNRASGITPDANDYRQQKAAVR